METEGKIISQNGQTTVVEIRRKGACGDSCAHCSGCSAQLMQIEAVCPFSVEKGDWVLISSARGPVFFGLFILFLVPLLLPLSIYLIFSGSGLEMWFSILSVMISISLIIALNKSGRFRAASAPKVIDVIIKARN